MSLFDLFLKYFFKKKIGLALSGGAARGFAHIGVLKILKDNNIPINYIAGVSAGAIIGAIFAAGMDPNKMETEAKKLVWFKFLRIPFGRIGILANDEVEKFIIEEIGNKNISDLKIPFAAVATDLRSGEYVVMTEGKVAKAAATSSAFPGIFSGVNQDPHFLVDGGIVCNLPTPVVRKMGADFVIAVDVVPGKPIKHDPQNQFETLGRSYDLMVHNLSYENRRSADVLIEPEIPEDVWHFDIDKAPRLIKAGEEAAKKKIPEIKAKLLLN